MKYLLASMAAVDCGYGQNGANGCDGDPSFSYTKYVVDPQVQLTVVGYGASDGKD